MRRVGWWAVAGFVVLAACRQLVGIGDTPPGASSAAGDDASAADGTGFDDTGACGPALATGACEACMQAHCCSRAAACAGYEPCNHLETCLTACNGDAPCRAQCGARYGLGNDTATPPLEACLANVCSGECGMPCGGMAALFPPASAAACESCIENGPCSAVTACATDEACQAAVRCQLAAQTVDVDEACPAVGDAGTIAVAVEEFPPIASACGNECSWGGDWSCLGKVSFPAPTYGAIQIEVNVASAAFATPVSGATVVLCGGDDVLCATPLARGVDLTDAHGNASIIRQPVTEEPSGYYLDVTAPGNVETLLFWYFPLSEPEVTIPTIMVTSDVVTQQAAAVGVQADLDAGQVLAAASDCRVSAAPGVQLFFEPRGLGPTFYYYPTGNSFPAPSSSLSSTGLQANAVAFNVATSVGTLTVNAAAPGDAGAYGPMQIIVRPGALTEIYAKPTK